MRLFSYTIILAIGAFSPWMAHACAFGMDRYAFDKMAPQASDIIAVQVLSLTLEIDPREENTYFQPFRGKIRILKHFRGSRDFDEITYRNNRCGGLRLEVSGIYVIATSATTSTIELDPMEAPILHLPALTFEPPLVLRTSETVERLEAAIRGEGSFAITTPELRSELSLERTCPAMPSPPAVLDSFAQ